MRILDLAAAWTGFVLVAGCLTAAPEPAQDLQDGQFYVSNQSFEHPTAHVKVWVDGVLVFDRAAPVEQQHTWVPFKVALTNTTHQVRALESDTGTEFTGSFVKDGPVWVVVQFWTSPDRFTMDVSDHEVLFD